MSQYHHGNLRQALLAEARRQLEEAGSEKLSLRALARATGVSQTAPYRHFPDRESLLIAIMEEAFLDLDQAIAEVESDSEDMQEVLINEGLAFVDFAVNNPERYKLMFGPLLARKPDYPELEQAARASMNRLRNTVQCCLKTDNSEQIWQMTLNAMALVHGYARMNLDGMSNQNPETGEPLDLRRALKAFALMVG